MSDKTFRLGVLGSGKGSNFVAIADAIRAGSVPAEVAIVISDGWDTGDIDVLERAMAEAARVVAEEHGYEVLGHQVDLVGTCPDCRRMGSS